ncbi:MAG: hypothetical protein LBG76_09785 [Treponema sp.]|nr:hypothetical protein [Treponema sp.]
MQIGSLGIEQFDYIACFVDFTFFDDIAIFKVLDYGDNQPVLGCLEVFFWLPAAPSVSYSCACRWAAAAETMFPMSFAR